MSVTLVSNTSPIIASGPAPAAVPLGFPASFGVVVDGTWPLGYRWQLNGQKLSDNARVQGSASNCLVIAGASYADLGSYTVVITNAFGAATSAPAALTLLDSNLVVNGSFESPAIVANTVATNVIPGWSPAARIVNGNPYPGNNIVRLPNPPYDPLGRPSGPATEDGQQVVDIIGGSLSQSVAVGTAGSYLLSWYGNTPISRLMTLGARIPFCNYASTLLDGASNIIVSGAYAVSNFCSLQGIVWQQRSAIVNLAPGAYRLTFQDLGGGLDPLLDNVELRRILPAAPGSPPSFLPVVRAGGTVQLTWTAVAGKTYQLQYKTALTQSNWITLSATTATNSIATATDPAPSDSQRFYRLVAPGP